MSGGPDGPPCLAARPCGDGDDLARLRRELEAARAEAAGCRAILASATEHAILTLDPAGRVTSWNTGAHRVFGWTEGEALGMDGRHLFTPEDRAHGALDAEMATALVGGRAAEERWHLRRDGRVFFAHGSLVPLRGTPVGGFLKIVRDRTADQLASAAFLSRLLESSSDCIKVLDHDGRLELMSAGGLRAMEIDDIAPYRGRPWLGFWRGEGALAAASALAEARTGRTARFSGEAATAKGTLKVWDVVVTPIPDASGAPGRLLVISRDVTAQRRADAALRASEERFRQFAENSANVLWILDVATKRLEYLSPAFERVWGEPRAAMLNDLGRWAETVHPVDRERAVTGLAYLLAGEALVQEYRIVRRDGSVRWVHDSGFPVRDEHGVLRRVAGIAQDVTERRRAEERAQALAVHDPLTGLPNRLLLLDRLNHCLARAERERELLAVMLLDLDGFKDVNDALGHAAGDRLLRQVAGRLASVLRASDTLARLGGDEFALVQPGARRPIDAEALAAKLLAALVAPFRLDGQEIHVGVSVGIALYPRDGSDPDTLLRHADLALYRAKADGRAGFRFFAPAMDAAARERLELTRELRRALQRGEFVLHYQPQLDLASGRFTGAEALVRWRHPDRGLVMPGEFIPLAEATGLIRPLGAWVLREACRQAAAWHAAGLEVVVSVNLSPAELRGPGTPPRVGQALSQAGLMPAGLDLELTEGVLLEAHGHEAHRFLHRLVARGVQLTIDDFGVGYSSLAYLRRLPVQKIKIDRSFMAAVGTDTSGETLLRSIVALGHSLGKRVVAEGVESAAQLTFLSMAGCDEAQGYHLARPMPAAEAERLLRARGSLPPRAPAGHVRKHHLAELLRSLDNERASASKARLRAAQCRDQNRLAQAQAEATLLASRHLLRSVREAEKESRSGPEGTK